MNTVITQIKSNDPTTPINTREFDHKFLSFCTCICLSKNKKMNLAKIFIALLENSSIRSAMLYSSAVDSDWVLLRKFLEYDSTLYKSKYIKNYLLSTSTPLKK